MLASLLVNEPVGHRPPEGLRPKRLGICVPDKIKLQGMDAIRAFLAEQLQQDAEREFTAGRHTPEPERVVPISVVEAIEDIRAEAIEINNEVALIFILAALD